MNLSVSRLKSTLTNPHSLPEHRAAALAELRHLATTNADAALVLQDFTSDLQVARTETVPQHDPRDAFAGSDELTNMFVEWRTTHDSPGRQMIKRWVDECKKEPYRGNIYRYWLPRLYAEAPAQPGNPGEDLAAQTFAKYLPHKWLTWELFAEIQGALRPDPTKTCFEQEPITKRVAPYIDRWRKIKADWETVHGPTGECLVDILYCASTDHPEYERKSVALFFPEYTKNPRAVTA